MRGSFEVFVMVLFLSGSLLGCVNAATSTPAMEPTVTVTAQSESCEGNLQASIPIVVRPAGIGGTDTTEFGYYATNVKAVSTSAGILVAWTVSVNGQYPVPNDYMRLLDNNARPIGDMSIPFERSVIQTPNFASTKNGAALTYCGIDQSGEHIFSAVLDPNGKLVAEQRRFSDEQSGCGDPDASAVWTGSRLLFAWSPQSYGPNGPNNYVLLDVANADGNNLSKNKLLVDAMSDPHIAFGHGRVLLSVATKTSSGNPDLNGQGITQLVIYRFDAEGNELGTPVILNPLGGREFGNSFAVPTHDGWLLLAEASQAGVNYYFAHLAPDGSFVSGPDLVNTGTAIGFLDVVPYAGGAAAWDGHNVYLFSEDGFITHEWQVAKSEYMGAGGLVVHKGRLFLTYTTLLNQSDPKTSEVHIRELQCVP